MSRISDELRTKATKMCAPNSSIGPTAPSYFRDLADRIDAEMVELPIGRDGKPIHVGDTVYDEFPDALTVNGITLSDCYAMVKASGKCAIYDGLDPERLTHERPDSLERIAQEIEEADVDGCTDWPARIRALAGKGDGR